VDLLNRTSPVSLDDATAVQLINGTITIPSLVLSTISGSDILGVDSAITFESGMRIDADGAPHAFYPDDKSGLDFLINARDQNGRWLGVVTDNNGQPVVQTANDPAPGFYVSTTSLEDPNRDRADPRRYVDSEAVNYIVIPGGLQAKVNNQSARLGDFAVVIRPETGAFVYAIVGDIGPRKMIGEGSIALGKALGIPTNIKDPDPKKRAGIDHGIVYIVFAGSGNHQPLPQQEINQNGAVLFLQWGGMDKAKRSFPNLTWR
jgi:Fungal chitosanase of glycosyl hydrolase group 75